MVILIGGDSCSGKTLLAQKLLEKYKIPYLSIDHIKMGLIRGNKYCDFSATDSDYELTFKLWPIVKGIVMTNIENRQNIIIEGCYIPPEQVNDFETEYLRHIIPFFIGFSKNYLDKHFDSIIDHRSEIEYKKIDDYFTNKENFIRSHLEVMKRCKESNVKYFEINENYTEEIKEVYKWLDEQVKSLNQYI